MEEQESGYSWGRGGFPRSGRWTEGRRDTLWRGRRGERELRPSSPRKFRSGHLLTSHFHYVILFCLVCTWFPGIKGRWGVDMGDHRMVLTSRTPWGCFNASVPSLYLVGWYLVWLHSFQTPCMATPCNPSSSSPSSMGGSPPGATCVLSVEKIWIQWRKETLSHTHFDTIKLS